MEANTMNPDHTAPLGAVWSGSIEFAIKVVTGGKRVTMPNPNDHFLPPLIIK